MGDGHAIAVRTLTSYGAQLRLYYEATCSCGWEREQRRVTRARAASDGDAHLAKVGIGPDEPPATDPPAEAVR